MAKGMFRRSFFFLIVGVVEGVRVLEFWSGRTRGQTSGVGEVEGGQGVYASTFVAFWKEAKDVG